MSKDVERYYVEFGSGRQSEWQAGDDEPIDILPVDEDTFHVIYKGRSVMAKLVAADLDNGHFEIDVDGEHITLSIENDLRRQVKAMGFERDQAGGGGSVKAPMPGLVLDILIEEGAAIEAGDPLLILEAMKMENILKANGSAVVKRILVSTREKVDKNQLLIEFE